MDYDDPHLRAILNEEEARTHKSRCPHCISGVIHDDGRRYRCPDCEGSGYLGTDTDEAELEELERAIAEDLERQADELERDNIPLGMGLPSGELAAVMFGIGAEAMRNFNP